MSLLAIRQSANYADLTDILSCAWRLRVKRLLDGDGLGGDVGEHALKGEGGVAAGFRIDADAVDHPACDQLIERPEQVSAIDAVHGGAKALDAAEKKIEILSKSEKGEVEAKPFVPEDEKPVTQEKKRVEEGRRTM